MPNADHARRGAMIIVAISAKAQHLIRHDQASASLHYLQAAHQGVQDMDRFYPDSAEARVARKAYSIARKQYDVAIQKETV